MDPDVGNAYAPGPGSLLHSLPLEPLVEPMLQDALLRNLSVSVGVGLYFPGPGMLAFLSFTEGALVKENLGELL